MGEISALSSQMQKMLWDERERMLRMVEHIDVLLDIDVPKETARPQRESNSRTVSIRIRVSQKERQTLIVAANASDQKFSPWARAILLQAAKEQR